MAHQFRKRGERLLLTVAEAAEAIGVSDDGPTWWGDRRAGGGRPWVGQTQCLNRTVRSAAGNRA
jgi:hypothetical protein